MRHLIDPLDFSQEEITSLLDLADRIRSDPAAYQDVAAHKKLATLFYEPSTRTRLSFEAAMLNLGGHVLGFPSETVSSASKGESVADTIRVVSCYADIVAMRHPKEGAPFRASRYSRIPVINAGDGGHQHPTQTMTDLMTIRTRMGRLDNLTIGLCGDLKNGRTVHSLIKAMAKFRDIKFFLISPRDLAVPEYMRVFMRENNMWFTEVTGLESVIPQLDVLYMTRIQRERFVDPLEYERNKGIYILTRRKLERAKPSMLVMHPLPRVDEISIDVDDDPRAVYFQQARYGMFARMALMERLQKGRKTGLTFAPEAGTQRLRDAINKNLTEEDLLESCRRAFAGGYSAVKLYFMLGLPTETDEDVLGIAKIADDVWQVWRDSTPNRSRGVRITVSTSWFVPKPHTAFQWEPQNTMEQLAEKQKFLREKLRLRSVTFSWSEPHLSFLEAAFARGDRRLCKVMLAAHRRGCRFDGWNEEFKFDEWMAAFEECGLTCSQFANKRFDLDAPLPWDHIDCGVTKEFLKREWHKAQNAQTSPDCRIKCHGCGMKQFVKGVCKSCE